MCGIVGHLGPKNSVEKVLQGLERLEYRGYDSAGVSFIDDNNELRIYKKSGRLENLKMILSDQDTVARSCIGHTRWATHGVVNDNNSHPHNSETISIVHNGIIENAATLKNQLLKEGERFHSETDSEVFLVLLSQKVNRGYNFREAFCETFKVLTGNSAIVALNGETNEIYAIKRGAPLVCGINEVSSEVLVSSDPYALAGMVDKLYFPEDEVVCHLSAANKNLLNFYNMSGEKTTRYISKIQDLKQGVVEKGRFGHFMHKEIHEQSELMRSLSQYYFGGEGQESLNLVSQLSPTHIHIIACGTAYYAGLVIKNIIEKDNAIPCSADIASEFRYREPLIQKDHLAIFVSQSGETADTLAAQELCQQKGLKTVSIVNVENSSLYRACDYNLIIRAGVEIGVASTKAFSQQVLMGKLLSFALSKEYESSDKKVKLATSFSLLAERVDLLLASEQKVERVAEEIFQHRGFFYTGRGVYFPIALEGALKLKEIAYVHAEGYAAGELKHGPIAMIDDKMVNVALVGPELFEKTISNIQEIRARKGVIVSIGPKNSEELEAISDYFIPLDFRDLGDLSPVYINVASQLFAYHIALKLGTDIDKPRNLAKSVTVE